MKRIKNSITKLISDFEAELLDRNYIQETRWSYSKRCRLLAEWCERKGIDYLTEDFARSYCNEVVGGCLIKKEMTYIEKMTIRVVRMLVQFQETGTYDYRTCSVEYNFVTSLSKYIKGYLLYCSEKKTLSMSSINNRRLILFRFDKYLKKEDIEITAITSTSFETFFSSDLCVNRKSTKTCLREFYHYLFDIGAADKDYAGYIPKEPKIHTPEKIPTTYTEEEIRMMLASIDRSSAKGKRDYLIVLIAAEYGLRASDILGLRMEQIDWDNNKITITQNKTGELLSLPLLASIGNAIIDYIKYGRPSGGDDVIIVQHENAFKGKRLKSPTIHSIVAASMRAANISNWKEKKHGPHSLRHSLASNMLKKGTSMPVISSILGHKSINTTKTYLSIDIEKLRQCCLTIPKITSKYFRKEIYL